MSIQPHATIVDPDAHQVLFENEHVRVIQARASHGWESAMHSHLPMLVVNLGTGRQKVTWADGTTRIVDLNPGAVVWQDDAFDHSWELLAGDVNVVLVEVKSAATPGEVRQSTPGDDVPAEPSGDDQESWRHRTSTPS